MNFIFQMLMPTTRRFSLQLSCGKIQEHAAQEIACWSLVMHHHDLHHVVHISHIVAEVLLDAVELLIHVQRSRSGGRCLRPSFIS